MRLPMPIGAALENPKRFWIVAAVIGCSAIRVYGETLVAVAFLIFGAFSAQAQILSPEDLASHIEPPYELGEKLSDDGIWSIRDRQGVDAGYVFEAGPLVPLPGFSGAPIHVLVML